MGRKQSNSFSRFVEDWLEAQAEGLTAELPLRRGHFEQGAAMNETGEALFEEEIDYGNQSVCGSEKHRETGGNDADWKPKRRPGRKRTVRLAATARVDACGTAF